MKKKKLAIILGIRPDVIRASLILNSIREEDEFEVFFIWSDQHYSDNLKDIGPPPVYSKKDLIKWTFDLHNMVNKMLNKKHINPN